MFSSVPGKETEGSTTMTDRMPRMFMHVSNLDSLTMA